RNLGGIQGQTPPALVLRREPRVQERDPRRAQGMAADAGRRGQRSDRKPQLGGGAGHLWAGPSPNQERAAGELASGGLEGLFGRFEDGLPKTEAQRRQS